MQTDHSINWSPGFIGIGAERSATTWCWACLDEHPQICISHPKELNYFNKNYDRGAQWYRKHFTHNLKALISGEITPVYMYDPLVCERIARDYPKVRILVILRNPYERALSHLLLVMRKEAGVVDTDDVVLAKKFAGLDDKYLKRSLYFRGLKPYFKSFPREQIIIRFYEDLQDNYKDFLRSLFLALSVDPDFMPKSADKIINRTSNYRWPILFMALMKLSQKIKTSPITNRLLELLLRRTNVMPWFLMVFEFNNTNKTKPKLDFDELFGAAGRELIAADIDRLVKELHLKVPESWDRPNA